MVVIWTWWNEEQDDVNTSHNPNKMNQDNVDFCARDKRDFGEPTGALAITSFLALASWTIGAPIALVNGLVSIPGKLNKPKSEYGPKLSFPPISEPLVEVKPLAEREFDLVMYGATGFTGSLCCRYLATQYGTKIKWAIAGRRLDALEKIKTECVAINPQLSKLVIIQVDSSNERQLQEMCSRTRVVVTTVGPFIKYGTPLVRACIATKSNVCDITGESNWAAGLIDNYDVEARKAGSKVLSFCGHDCIPWDLSTFILAKKLKQEKGEDLVKIEFVDALRSKPSGGTLATVFEAGGAGDYKPKNSTFHPFLRTDDGSPSPFHLKNKSHILPHFAPTKQWTGPFVMSTVNGEVVGRSNALNGYGSNVVYMEHWAADSYSSVIARYLQLVALGPILFLPTFLRSQILPEPGEGSTDEEMERGFLQATAIATGEKGSRVGSRMYFRCDAGYRDTARMLVETGLTIALSPEKCVRSSGVLTPGACCAEALFDRLLATGTEFSFVTDL